MGDLSSFSTEWWQYVTNDASVYYQKYQQADQFARLSLKPVASAELSDPK